MSTRDELVLISTREGLTSDDADRAAEVLEDVGLDAVRDRQVLTKIVGAMRRFHECCEDAQEHAKEPISVEGPADWRLHSARVMERYRPQQRAILGVFGLERALASWKDVAPLLQPLINSQTEEGIRLKKPLEYPVAKPGGRRAEHCQVWLGRSWRDGERTPSLIRGWVDSPPLFNLGDLAQRIARETGLETQRVVAWLLADEDVSLPWIEIEFYPVPALESYALEIMVGSPAVRPEEVAKAYAEALADPARAMAGPDAHEALVTLFRQEFIPAETGGRLAGTYRRSRTTSKTAQLIAHVDAYKRTRGISGTMPPGAWDELCREFGDYKNANSMRVQYTRAKGATRDGTPKG